MSLRLEYVDGRSKSMPWWYVIFSEHVLLPGCSAPRWVDWFTSPGFRHVFAITDSELGSMVVDPMWFGLDVRWSPYKAQQCAQACADTDHVVLKLAKLSHKGYPFRGIMTCVSVIKSVIGLHNWMVVTPRQLYNELIRQGAMRMDKTQ